MHGTADLRGLQVPGTADLAVPACEDEYMAKPRKTRPDWTQSADNASAQSSRPSGPVESQSAATRALAALWGATGSGASGARGYHYQDDVSVWLAARVYADRLDVYELIPEGLEDCSTEGGDCWHVQAKSHQLRMGCFSGAAAAKHVITAWREHQKRVPHLPGSRLAVVFERPIDEERFAGWGVVLSAALSRDHPFFARLRTAYAAEGLAKSGFAAMCDEVNAD